MKLRVTTDEAMRICALAERCWVGPEQWDEVTWIEGVREILDWPDMPLTPAEPYAMEILPGSGPIPREERLV